MEVGLVHKVDIDQEMQQAYLDYAMSVIVARALPDARDGLKPVHRRILYAMHDMGLRPEQSYKKSARIVGEVLGKYHPHGDMAVYEAMARMAQDFSLRYMLVDGQGNFGSVDGDPPAAMRYTEARLATLATQMLADIGKNTVDFSDNFDGTLTEPTVLPAALPNLLVNGATGIAVGMATSIPPHNLNEIVDAMQYLLQNWERLDDISIEDLLQFVQGPDFPTGGLIVQAAGGDGLVSAYSTGRGQVTIQARTHLEEMERGRSRIIVTELPYMTNKSSLIERIAELAREERLEGIADLRDESDRQGMRIVIELSKTADPEKTLKDLLKHTPLQTTFSFIMLALVDGEPRHLSLKQAMRVYLEHRIEIVRRRSQYDLDRARQRSHILEGLRVALKNLDEVIDIIRKSPDVEAARTRLMKRFKLTEIQTQAILEMPLRRLAALERKKIEEEYKEIQALIKDLEGLLRSPKKMRQVVGDELLAVKEQFGDRRRTHIIQLKEGQTTASLLTDADSIPDKTIWLSITANGLISRSLDDSLPQLSGQDAPSWLVRASTRDTLYLVSESGDAASLPVHAVPETSSPTQGAPLNKVSALGENTPLAAAFTLPARSGKEATTAGDEKRFVLSVSRQGMVKKSPVSELPGASASMFTLARVNEEDHLGWVIVTSGLNELLLVTAGGMGIRFKEEEVRPMGLAAAGVMGIKLAGNDELAGVEIFDRAGDLFLATDTGKAKRVPLPEFPLQGRYGQGVQTWKLNVGERIIGSAIGKGTTRIILHPSRLLPKALRLDEAPMQTRAGRGVNILEQKGGDHILRLTMPIVPYHLEAFSPVAGEKEGGKAVARKRAPAAAPPTKQQAAQPVKKSAAGKAAKKTADAKTAAVKIPGEKSTGKTSPKGSPSAKTATVKKAAEKPTPASTAPAKTLPPKTAPAKKAAGKTAATRSTAEKGSSGKATTGKVGTEKAAVSKTAGGKAASSKQAIVQPPVTKKPASKITAAPTGAPVEKTNPPAVKASKTTPPKKLPAAKSAPQKVTPAAKKGTRGSQKAKEAPAAQKSPAAKKAPPAKGTTPDKKAPAPKKTPAEKLPAQAPAASKTAVPKAPPAIPQKAQRKTKTDSSG